MKTKIIAALLVAASAAIAAPAFAAGYNAAPSYQPSAGAPASQQDQNAQPAAAERAAANTHSSYGGTSDQTTQSGGDHRITFRSIFFGHGS
jgi:hypothetical protein